MAAPLIAVVNHDPIFIRLMENILVMEGYRVMTINDGTTAYEVLKRETPDGIIVDTWLGERHAGWDLIQVLKLDAKTARIPILVCSSDDPDDVEKKLRRSRYTMELMHKPFDTEQLLTAVRAILGVGLIASRDGSKPDGRAP